MFKSDYTFTKRVLGLLLLVIGVGGFLAILAVDVLDFGREGGIGPSQRLGLAAMTGLALLGLSLLPLGERPA